LTRPANPDFYVVTTVEYGYIPYSNRTLGPWFQAWCIEDINEDNSLTAPWTTPFVETYYYHSQVWYTTQADSEGTATWGISWEDSTAPFRNGLEQWRYNPTTKHQQRRTKVKVPTGLSGVGGGS
jgi:hypothetical protein